MEKVTERPAAWAGNHAPKLFPFDPKYLHGISERQILHHWDTDYGGAVKQLNAIEEQLGKLPPGALPAQRGALKQKELELFNSVVLHELYFDCLGDGARPENIERALEESFGSYSGWEREFRSTGLSLASGKGWVVLYYLPVSKNLRTGCSADDTQAIASGMPVLAMDMHLHAYAIDYGNDVQQYVDAFMVNIKWSDVSKRLDAARKTV